MSRKTFAWAWVFLSATFLSPFAGSPSSPPGGGGGLWEAIEPNLGQAPPEAAFVVRSPRAACLLGPTGLEVFLAPPPADFRREGEPCPRTAVSAFRLRLEGASAGTFRTDNPLPGVVHVYRGSDPSRWVTGIPRYGRVVWEDPLPGVDVDVYPLEEGLSFDFRLAPFVDTDRLRLAVESLDGTPVAFRVDPKGNAAVETASGLYPLRLPAVYALKGSESKPLQGAFTLHSSSSLGIRVVGRSPEEPLVVDPTLIFSSYLGGSEKENSLGMALDAGGGVVLAGYTNSPDFPGAGGGPMVEDAFLAYFTSPNDLAFVALVGGESTDYGYSFAQDDAGHFYLGGYTQSYDFPQPNGLYPGGVGRSEGFVVRLDPTGSLAYGTTLGGYSDDYVLDLAVGPDGRVYLTGYTSSMDFPTVNPLQSYLAGTNSDGFLAAVDTFGSGFTALLFSTFLGGTGLESLRAVAEKPDQPGVAYLCGISSSSDFPVTQGAFQTSFQGGLYDGVFLEVQVFPSPQLLYSTYLGSPESDSLEDLVPFPGGSVALAGCTSSASFPLASPTQGSYGGGICDAVVALVNPDLPPFLHFSTFLGGVGWDSAFHAARCAASPEGGLLVVGATSSSDLPLLQALEGQEVLRGPQDAFLAAWTFPGLAPQGPAGPSSFVPTRTFTSYLGGRGEDAAWTADCLAGPPGNPVLYGVAGKTDSPDFPLAGSSFQNAYGGGLSDVFYAVLSSCSLSCTAQANPVKGVAPQTVFFTATADANGCSENPVFFWDFGDGGTSTEQNPTHTYENPGSYDWTLTVQAGTETCTSQGTVSLCGLTCQASASDEKGFAPLSVSFAGNAGLMGSCNLDNFLPSYFWDFGDGGTSREQNPTHTYTNPGTYTWALTVTFDQVVCTQTGSVEVCELSCTATAFPGVGVPPLSVSFSGDGWTSGSCPLDLVFSWDFGDGYVSNEPNPTHTYTSPGSYTWSFAVTQGPSVCTRNGTVLVQTAALYGYVEVQGEDFFPLDGEGILGASVTARNVATGAEESVPVTEGFYLFPSLPSGTYTLEARVQYKDFIFEDARFHNFGCPAPSQGFLVKEVTRRRPDPVTVTSSGNVSADIFFPPPLVFLHGVLGCYGKWYSDGPSPENFWDNRARAEGLLTFTPNYTWWGDSYPWSLRAAKVYEQVQADLHGLSERGGGVLNLHPSLPWNLLAYDMGGLVARVLTSGSLGTLPVTQGLQKLVLLAVPNSGSDLMLGGLGNGLLDTETVVRRFNEVYPDFGPWTHRVYAIGGDEGWWGTETSDGQVPLVSAFSIYRLACGVDPTQGPRCHPYPAVVFENGTGHIFHYDHAELGSPISMAEVLEGVILPFLQAPQPAPPLAISAADDPNPLSPIGSTLWGTGARSTGTKGGTVNAFVGGAVTQSFVFRVGATDGMALAVFVSDGAGLFTLHDPSGQAVISGNTEDHFVWSVLNPEAGEWTLAVTVESGSVTFRATSFENSPAGIEAHVTQDRYAPGEAVHYRLDLAGDPGDLALDAVTATLLTGGSVLETVTLYDDGAHGDGLAGDGSFGGDGTAPALPGAYAALFTARGTYDGEQVTRIARDSLAVVSPIHAFTGTFADAGTNLDDDDPFEALVFTVDLDLPSAGTYALAADLYDASGFLLARASSSFTVSAPGPVSPDLLFDLSEASCASFGAPLFARNLRLFQGATLIPLDVWESGVSTAVYPAASFDCQAALQGPRVRTVYPDEGLQGHGETLDVSGENFLSGTVVDVGEGISVVSTSFLSPQLLRVRIAVSPTAAPGPRPVTVTNPGGASHSLPAAFTVVPDRPPSLVLLAPQEDYVVLGTSPLFVAASAADDEAVVKVVFLVDGQVGKEDLHHPFTFLLDPAFLAPGAHRVTARAYDDAGRTAEASFLAVKDPPAITAVTKLTAPFRIKLVGQNFQAGAQVFLGSDAQPWSSTSVKNSTKVILGKGKSLKAKFPQGERVTIRLVNPDGGRCEASYTRP